MIPVWECCFEGVFTELKKWGFRQNLGKRVLNSGFSWDSSGDRSSRGWATGGLGRGRD